MAKLTGGAVVVLLFEVFATLAHISRAVGTPTPILVGHLTLSGGQDYAYILLFVPPPPGFYDIPTALNSEREQEANSSSEGRQ